MNLSVLLWLFAAVLAFIEASQLPMIKVEMKIEEANEDEMCPMRIVNSPPKLPRTT